MELQVVFGAALALDAFSVDVCARAPPALARLFPQIQRIRIGCSLVTRSTWFGEKLPHLISIEENPGDPPPLFTAANSASSSHPRENPIREPCGWHHHRASPPGHLDGPTETCARSPHVQRALRSLATRRWLTHTVERLQALTHPQRSLYDTPSADEDVKDHPSDVNFSVMFFNFGVDSQVAFLMLHKSTWGSPKHNRPQKKPSHPISHAIPNLAQAKHPGSVSDSRARLLENCL